MKSRLLELCVRDYAWIHTGIGLIGNICFIIGSVLFMKQAQTVGIYFFVAGSVGMFIGNLGNAVVMKLENRWRMFDRSEQ